MEDRLYVKLANHKVHGIQISQKHLSIGGGMHATGAEMSSAKH
jgi:hypothetical protein